jgi:hypothetical protein
MYIQATTTIDFIIWDGANETDIVAAVVAYAVGFTDDSNWGDDVTYDITDGTLWVYKPGVTPYVARVEEAGWSLMLRYVKGKPSQQPYLMTSTSPDEIAAKYWEI